MKKIIHSDLLYWTFIPNVIQLLLKENEFTETLMQQNINLYLTAHFSTLKTSEFERYYLFIYFFFSSGIFQPYCLQSIW